MADKSFGVKELNLISASGTPTITSPNSVNINATNVAISTDITVGGMVSLGAGTSISSPGSNVLTFGTNSTEKLRITSDGNLQAIGASDVRLTLGSAGTAGTNDSVHIRGDGNDLKFMNANGGRTIFERNGTESLRITSGGDVVIGNSSAADGAHFQHYQSAARHQSFQSSNGDLAIVTDNNSNPAAYIKGTGTADLLQVVDGSTTVFTIEDGGDVVLGNNCNLVVAAGNGIDFSADPDASGRDSELLDDYEEGTFTPTVSVEGQSNATTDKQYGRYVKVGKMVTVWCYVQLNGTPSGRATNTAWQHGGLPFTKVNTAGGFDIPGSILYWTIDSSANMNGTPPYSLVPRLFNNSSGGRIRAHDSSNNQYGQNASYLLKDNTEYTYTFTYEVA